MSQYPYHADQGQTDLMAAVYNGDADEVVRILTMPCDIDAQDCHGMTALMFGALKGHTDAVLRLVEHGADLEIQSGQRWTALMYAVRGGHLESVLSLLRAKADPDVHGDYDTFDTPLTIAAWRGHFAIIRALVAAGANISLHGGNSQCTAECVARLGGYHDISEFLCCNQKRPVTE
jgi:ankyrin repeat protein